MNRENIFKAKRKDNGEWIEGYYVFCRKHHYILPILTEAIGYDERENEWIEIAPDTLCRHTGFTDKNDKEIWENDILRGHKNDDDLAKVVFGEFNVIDAETLEVVDRVIGWHTEVIETDALSKCEPFCLPMPLADFYIKRSEFEVFGNIFDNADLLEVE